jgi:hypothetical protein
VKIIFRGFHEHADLILVSEWFAEALAEGELDEALRCAETAQALTNGAFLVNQEADEGKCEVVTRDARHCGRPAMYSQESLRICGLHARYIQAHKADA